ncbi:MAG: hypothetical protein HWE27_17170 [Gammaproteobacteria bacterium]|nr:hypothetical protein [Gammaproteobacteria bacterium]
MIKVRKVVKYIFITFIMIFIILGGYATYIRLPTGTDFELTEPPEKRLGELISIASSEKIINPNLYAASTFQPNDPLFKAIIAIQQSRWYEAGELLKPLVDQGNADAMFWLADITYRSSAFSGWEGAELFEKSAKLGNPYAALKLSPKFNSYQCKMRMRTYCDKKWGSIGLDILKEKAENGDAKAAYSYLLYTRFDDKSFDYFDQFLDVVKQSIEIKYYRPLRHLVDMYETRENLNPYSRDVIPLEVEDRKVLANLLMIAALDNDTPSIALLNNWYLDVLPSQEKFDELVEKNLHTLDLNHYFIAYDYILRKFNQSKNDREYLITGYAYATLFDDYEGTTSYQNRRIFEMRLKDNAISELTEEEKERSQTIYKKLVEKANFTTYIDEARDAWDAPLDGY